MYITDNIISSAEWRGMQRGMQQGMQRGRLEGMQQVIISMLQNGLTIEKVVEYTSLDRAEVERAAQTIRQGEKSWSIVGMMTVA